MFPSLFLEDPVSVKTHRDCCSVANYQFLRHFEVYLEFYHVFHVYVLILRYLAESATMFCGSLLERTAVGTWLDCSGHGCDVRGQGRIWHAVSEFAVLSAGQCAREFKQVCHFIRSACRHFHESWIGVSGAYGPYGSPVGETLSRSVRYHQSVSWSVKYFSEGCTPSSLWPSISRHVVCIKYDEARALEFTCAGPGV